MMRVSHLGTDEVLYDYRVHDNSLNAKAAEFKIAEKVAKLMEYEKERYAFYYKPFEVYGSFKQSDLYYGDFPYNFHEATRHKIFDSFGFVSMKNVPNLILD